jgi:hypothetical protein
MTENEWFDDKSSVPLLAYLRGASSPFWPNQPLADEGDAERCSGRKVVLFAHACCERMRRFPLNKPTFAGMELLCRYATGQLALGDLLAALKSVRDTADKSASGDFFPFWQPQLNQPHHVVFLARKCSIVTGHFRADGAIRQHFPQLHREQDANWKTNGIDLPEWQSAFLEEESIQADILRDIIGNPFRSISLDPRWLTSTVVEIAQAIYRERAFDKMPILADALMDAGCDSEDILNHCRSDRPHVRGCWVVDLLLGKE